MSRTFIILLVVVLAISSACTSQKDLVLLNMDPKMYGVTNDSTVTYQIQVPEPYKIKSEDQLLITVSGLGTTTMESINKTSSTAGIADLRQAYFSPVNYVVDKEGFINLPLVGDLKVVGMTVEQIQDSVNARLINSGQIREARSLVRLTNFYITVMGEVNLPGVLQISQEQVNIVQALGLAGDLTDYANLHRVKLIREIEKGTLKTVVLDLGDPATVQSPFFYLQPGDILYVEPAKSKSLVVTGQSTSVILSSISFVIVLASTVLQIINLSQNNPNNSTAGSGSPD